MAAAPDAIRRWAAAHAATVHGTGPRLERGQPPPGPLAAPTVIAAVSEPRFWTTGSPAFGVSAGITPDGEVLLAVGEEDGTVSTWNAATGQARRRLAGHSASVYTVDLGYLPDGRLILASGDEAGTLRIWDAATGALLLHLADFIGPHDVLDPAVEVVRWGHGLDEQLLLAVGCSDNTVRIWDLGSGYWLRELSRPWPADRGRSTFCSVAWNWDHQGRPVLVAGRDDGEVVIWDAGTWEAGQVAADDGRTARGLAGVTRPDGGLLLATTRNLSPVIGLQTQRGDGTFASQSLDPGQGQLGAVAWVPLGRGRLILLGVSEHSLFIHDGHTLEQLFVTALDTGGRGVHNLGWALRPDGQLIVSSTSRPQQVDVWTITFDPPASPLAPRTRSPAEITASAASPDRRWPPVSQDVVADPPEDVSPALISDRESADTASVKCAVLPDGRVVAAVRYFAPRPGGEIPPVEIWDITSGVLVHELTGSRSDWSQLSWGRLTDGTTVLVTVADDNETVQIWDADTGRLVRQRGGTHGGAVRDLALVPGAGEQPLLVTGGQFDEMVRVWDPSTFDPVRELTERGSFVSTLSQGRLTDGTHCLVTVSSGQVPRIWDLASGELIRELTGPSSPADAHTVWCSAWGEDPDGRPELATGSGDGGIHFWDPGTGQPLRTIHTPHRIVYTLAWAPGGRRHSVLVSTGQDQAVRVWDPVDGTELYSQPADSPFLHAADLVRHPNGDLLLVLAEDRESGQGSPPFSVRRLATRTAGRPAGHPSDQPASQRAGRTRLTAQLARELPAWLLRLGRGDLWPPLGLVADLVTLTGPAVPAGPLAVLESEPGVARLRGLGWPPAARVAFAALLSSDLDLPARYRPPGDDTAGPAADAAHPADRVRAEALAHALRGQADDAGQPPWTPGLAGLRAAAAAVTDQAVALLLILGPGACAADPLLPLRLAQYVTRLPPLAPRELRLIASVTSEYAAAGRAAAGTLTYSPGTAGLARSGPPARLLPTQLALPRDLLTVRLAEDQLLYRQHRGPAPPAPRPVTIILDTTPPTFGPAGNTLRTAAHLIARTMWDHGRQPALITLDRPESITELRSPADLMRIWASATLDGPGEPLAVALRTAVSLGQPALFCTHYRTARDHYRAGRATRLLTTHQPPEAPPLRPAGPWHAHLPPDPGGPELARAVAALLGSHATAGEPA